MFPFEITTIREVQHWQFCWLIFFASCAVAGLLVTVLAMRRKIRFGVAKPIIIGGAIGIVPGISIAMLYSILVGAQWFGGSVKLVNYLFLPCLYLLPVITLSIPLVIFLGALTTLIERSIRPLLHAAVLASIAGLLCYWVNDVLIYHYKAVGTSFGTSSTGYSHWIKE